MKPPPSVNLEIRPKDDDDAPAIQALRMEADSERLLLDEMEMEDGEKKLILENQFQAYQKHYEKVDWDKTECIVKLNGDFAGFFIVMQDPEEIRLADLIISGKFRGLGVGFAIIQNIQREAKQSKRPLRLHVEKMNSALGFYEQSGFRILEDRETHFFMEWTPPSLSGKTMYFPGR